MTSFHTRTLGVLIAGYLAFFMSPSGFCTDFATRIRTYAAQLAADSTQTAVRLELAKVYLQIEAYAEATAAYRHVIASLEARAETPEHRSHLSTAYYGLGLACAGQERFSEAVAAYTKAIAANPDSAYSHAALASAYANMHQYAAALDAYRVALGLNPNDAMIHHQIGNVYGKRGKRAAALQHQQQAIAIDPEFAAAHYQLGLLYAQENQWAAAIAAYRTAYAHDATLIEVLYNLAQAHRRAGDPAAARAEMTRFEEQKTALMPLQQLKGALQRAEGTAERSQILANIARLYLKNRFYAEAVQTYQKAIAMDPDLAAAYNGLGMAYTLLEKYPEAVTAQQAALERHPDSATAYAGLGLIYFRQNAWEQALAHYQRAAALEPELLEAQRKIGIILLNQKRYAAAAEIYRNLVKLKSDDPEVYHNLGLCYAHQARAADAPKALTLSALTAFEKAIALATDAPETPLFLTETYYLIGELQASLADLRAAEQAYLRSGTPKAYHALARLRAAPAKADGQKPDLEIARRYAQEAIRLAPNVARYYNTLARIDFQRGDYLRAETAIRNALALDPGNRNYQQGLKQIAGKIAAE